MNDTSAPQLHGPYWELIDGWTDLWNGDLAAAGRICAPQVRVRFGAKNIAEHGDRLATPEELADLIADFRSTRPGLTYAVVDAQTTESWGYCVWDACLGDLRVGGIDAFTFDRDGISHVYSVTGQRTMSW